MRTPTEFLKRNEKPRHGTAVALLLVVLLIVGLLMQQALRTLWTFQQSQQQQLRIAQAQELLEIGKQLDQTYGLARVQQLAQSPIIVPVGDRFGRIDLKQDAGDGAQKSYWVAKLPVDPSGDELLDRTTVTVTHERPLP